MRLPSPARVLKWAAIGLGLTQAVTIAALVLVDSVRNSDFPMVQVLAMTIAAVYVVVNLVADLLSILFTPRARTAISS